MREKGFRSRSFKILSLLIFVFIALLCALIIIHALNFSLSRKNDQNNDLSFRDYHVVVLGTYETKSFMQKVYEGAKSEAEAYNAVVELYVPSSKAQNLSLENLFEYANFVNADGIIAYINSSEEKFQAFHKIDNSLIPLVTTGHFSSDISQISFIGNNWRELGNTIGKETAAALGEKGKAFIISPENNDSLSYSNMANCIQTKLKMYSDILFELKNLNEIKNELDAIIKNNFLENEKSGNVCFVCMNEDDTLKMAQLLAEANIANDDRIKLVGFGNNEICQYYFDKGTISLLISLDPFGIGHSAIKELFEFRNKGSANNYMAADVIIQKQENRDEK